MASRFTFLALVASGFLGCAPKSELDVEFDMVKVPADYYRNIKVLGISKGDGISPRDMKAFVTRLKDCRVAKEVNTLDHYVHSTQRDPKKLTKDLEKEIERWTDAKTANAVLAIKVIKEEEKEDIQDVKLVTFEESLDHEWHPAFGYDYTDRLGFSGSEEFAAKVKAVSYGIGLRKNHYDVAIRYVIYNTQTKKIIAMDVVAGRANINLYSQAPELSPTSIKDALTKSLMDRLVSKLCPVPKKRSKRQLVALEKPKGDDFTVNEGIELASTNQWEQAATKWRTANTKDKNSPYIANNLGIYSERSGNLEDAARYYQKAQKMKNSPRIPGGYYEDILSEYSFEYKFKESEPRVYAVFGANEAYVLGGQTRKLQVGAKYPVYRVKHLRYVGKLADGIEYTEVGIVEVEKIEKGAVPMAKIRIKEFIAPLEIEIGDILLAKPIVKASSSVIPDPPKAAFGPRIETLQVR